MAGYGRTTLQVLKRVRQLGGLPVTNDFAIEILSRVESILNVATKAVTTGETFTVPAEKCLFSMEELTGAADIVSVTQANRELAQAKTLPEFNSMHPNWFRATSDLAVERLEAWHQIGRDYFILWPILATPSTVTIKSVKLIEPKIDFSLFYDTPMELPDEYLEPLLLLTESILLMRSRDTAFIENRLKRFMEVLRGKI